MNYLQLIFIHFLCGTVPTVLYILPSLYFVYFHPVLLPWCRAWAWSWMATHPYTASFSRLSQKLLKPMADCDWSEKASSHSIESIATGETHYCRDRRNFSGQTYLHDIVTIGATGQNLSSTLGQAEFIALNRISLKILSLHSPYSNRKNFSVRRC